MAPEGARGGGARGAEDLDARFAGELVVEADGASPVAEADGLQTHGKDTELPGEQTGAGIGVAVEVAGEVTEDLNLLGGSGGATDEGEGGEADVPEAEELGRGEVARGVGEGVGGGDGGGAEVAGREERREGGGRRRLGGAEGRREDMGREGMEVLRVPQVGEVSGDGGERVRRGRHGGGCGGRERGRGAGRRCRCRCGRAGRH